jgi:hypothetical protein
MAKETKENEILEEETKNDLVLYEVPDDNTDFPYQRVILNGKPYEVKKGEAVEVPAGVAEILKTRQRNIKKIKDALRERKNAAKGL